MMSKHTVNVAGRPARDDLEVPLDNEPDTPLHHSYRGLTAAAWKNKLVLYAQVLIVFLLIAAAGVWFFIDVEDLQHSSRTGRAGMQNDESFPYNFLGVAENSMPRSRALSRAESVGGYVDENEEYRLKALQARGRWEEKGDPPTPESLFLHSEPRRDVKVVFLIPQCCEAVSLDEAQLQACNQHLMTSCDALADTKCYIEAVQQPPCNLKASESPSYHAAYLSALRRAVPHLKDLGWESVQIHHSIGDSLRQGIPCAPNASSIELAVEAVKAAEVVVAESSAVPEIVGYNKDARVVAVDTSTSSVLKGDPAWSTANIAQIWRAQILSNQLAQYGPLLNGSANLAAIEGASEEEEFQITREVPIPSSLLSRAVPILSHAHRYRFPFDCGGNPEHARFVGAFQQNSSHWVAPKMTGRTTDVAFMPPLTPSETLSGVSASAQKLMATQRNSLTKVLRGMQIDHPDLDIQITSSNSGSYTEYLQQLRNTKILITLGGVEEWSEQDFDAILSGCLLLKVNPASFKTFPDVFDPTQFVLETDASFSQLPDTLLRSLKDSEGSQNKANRAFKRLLELSDVKRYAAAVDEQLLVVTQSVPHTVTAQSQ